MIPARSNIEIMGIPKKLTATGLLNACFTSPGYFMVFRIYAIDNMIKRVTAMPAKNVLTQTFVKNSFSAHPEAKERPVVDMTAPKRLTGRK
jgi:hypothetical protein